MRVRMASLQPAWDLTVHGWLACCCRGCVYSHYRLPTVVMSRLAEQFDKVGSSERRALLSPALACLCGQSALPQLHS